MLLISCFLYLLGVVLVLYFKPSIMFDANGVWKEFSLKQDDKHTWFPFWLFCILWAVLSYSIVSFGFDYFTDKDTSMQSGYYVLDKKATKKDGVPKYVYLGSENPED